MNLSEPARTALEWLSTEYTKAGCPNHREWAFAPSQQEWGAFAELSAQGYIEPRQLRGHQQIWGLTEYGRAAVLRLAQTSRSSPGRVGGVFDEYASRLTKEQRSILDRAAAFQLGSDKLIEGKHVRLLFSPDEGDHVHEVLQSLVPAYLEASARKRPYDTYALTPAGLVLAIGDGRVSKLIEDILQLFRARLAQNPTFNSFSWDDLKRLGFALGDDEFPLAHVTIKTMGLNGSGSSTFGPPPSFTYTLPHDIEDVRRCQYFYDLLDLRQRQHEERVREESGREEPGARYVDAPPLNSFSTTSMSNDASQILCWLRDQYVKTGYPNHKVWTFKAPPEHRAVFAELRAHGYIETLGVGNAEWRLTDFGQQTILQTQEPAGGYTVNIHHHHGETHMGNNTVNISGSTVGAIATGDHATATGHVTVGSTGTLTQEQHKAAITKAQNALNEDQDALERIDERLYEVLGQFLRLAPDPGRAAEPRRGAGPDEGDP